MDACDWLAFDDFLTLGSEASTNFFHIHVRQKIQFFSATADFKKANDIIRTQSFITDFRIFANIVLVNVTFMKISFPNEWSAKMSINYNFSKVYNLIILFHLSWNTFFFK